MAEPLLAIRGLAVNYGHVQALRGIDLALGEGGITALIGGNGAGKSTTLLSISGLVRKTAGSIRFAGEDITRLPPHEIVRRGLVQVPEGRAILSTLSVRENLELGAHVRKDKAQAAMDLRDMMERFPVLGRRAEALAGNLSGGEQQMLAVARALMAKPRLLLLDEPSMGLAPLVVQEIFAALTEINRAGLTVLLVEQNVKQALRVAHLAYVLETGRIVMTGGGKELLHSPAIVEAYLGG